MGENMIEEKIAVLDRYIISQKSRLENGEVLMVQIDGGVLRIFNERDPNGDNRTVSLLEEFDAKLDISISDLLTTINQE